MRIWNLCLSLQGIVLPWLCGNLRTVVGTQGSYGMPGLGEKKIFFSPVPLSQVPNATEFKEVAALQQSTYRIALLRYLV